MNEQVSFTPARFNTGDKEEKSIVTSTGPYVITWNFRRVKQGYTKDYQIKKYSEVVMADQFLYGRDKAIVVALPNDVTMTTKLESPMKTFKSDLTTPVKNLKSRSSIVNSPY